MMMQRSEIELLAMAISAVLGGTIVWVSMVLRRALRAAKRTVLPSAEIMTRFDRLELTLDSVAIEVERISESERFATRLLAGRSEGLLPPPSRDARTITPH